MSEPAQATINGTDLVAWGDASFKHGAAIAFDLRAPEGPTPIFEQTRRLLQLGMVVGFYDTDVVVPSFAVGLLDGTFIVCTEDGTRTNFASLEGALRHGLTLREVRHG